MLHFKHVSKDRIIYPMGEQPTSLAFIHQGLIRAYVIDENGNEYNKNFFAERRFPGCMSALLNNEPSWIEIQALETCEIIVINHTKFRHALLTHVD